MDISKVIVLLPTMDLMLVTLVMALHQALTIHQPLLPIRTLTVLLTLLPLKECQTVLDIEIRSLAMELAIQAI